MIGFISLDAGDRIFWLWGSIPCLLMAWWLKSPGHHQAWYWLYRICNIWGCFIGNLVFFCWAKFYIWCECIFYNLKIIQRVKSWYGYPLECTLCCVLYFSCSKWFHLLSIKFSWCCDRSILLLLWSFLAICCGKQVLYQSRNTKIQVAYLWSW